MAKNIARLTTAQKLSEMRNIIKKARELKDTASTSSDAQKAYTGYMQAIQSEKRHFINESYEFFVAMFDIYGPDFIQEAALGPIPTFCERFITNPQLSDKMRLANWQYSLFNSDMSADAGRKILNGAHGLRAEQEAFHKNLPSLIALLNRLAQKKPITIQKFCRELMSNAQSSSVLQAIEKGAELKVTKDGEEIVIPTTHLRAALKRNPQQVVSQPYEAHALAPSSKWSDPALETNIKNYLTNNVYFTGTLALETKTTTESSEDQAPLQVKVTRTPIRLDARYDTVRNLKSVRHTAANINELITLIQKPVSFGSNAYPVKPNQKALDFLFRALYGEYAEYRHQLQAHQLQIKDSMDSKLEDDLVSPTDIAQLARELKTLIPNHLQATGDKYRHFLTKLYRDKTAAALLFASLKETAKEPLLAASTPGVNFSFKQYLYNSTLASQSMLAEITRQGGKWPLAKDDRKNALVALNNQVFINTLRPSLLTRALTWLTRSYHVTHDITIDVLMTKIRSTKDDNERVELLEQVLSVSSLRNPKREYWRDLTKAHWAEIAAYLATSSLKQNPQLSETFDRWLTLNGKTSVGKAALRLEIKSAIDNALLPQQAANSTVVVRRRLAVAPTAPRTGGNTHALEKNMKRMQKRLTDFTERLTAMEQELSSTLEEKLSIQDDLNKAESVLQELRTCESRIQNMSEILQKMSIKPQVEGSPIASSPIKSKAATQKEKLKNKARKEGMEAGQIAVLQKEVADLTRRLEIALKTAADLTFAYNTRLNNVESQQQQSYRSSYFGARPATPPNNKNPTAANTPVFSPVNSNNDSNNDSLILSPV